MSNIQILPIVEKITDLEFNTLLSLDLTPNDRLIIESLREAQQKYKILTRKRFAYYCTIYNKYLPIRAVTYAKKYYRIPTRERERIPGETI